MIPPERKHRRPDKPDRGVVLLAALIVITMGALIGSTAIYYSQAERSAAEVSLRRSQARAMAWSGVQAVMAELSAQRDQLLRGESPTITDHWSSASDTDRVRWGFRILPAGGGGSLGASESGKLCINTAAKDMLVRAGVAEGIAERIVTARTSRPFASIEELLGVEGVTEVMMYGGGGGVEGAPPSGPPAESPVANAASTQGGPAPRHDIENKFDLGDFSLDKKPQPAREAPGSPSVPSSGAPSQTNLPNLPLYQALTVFSFDPDIQVGFGAKASEGAGKRRINLNSPWSDRLGDAIERRFDKDVAGAVKGIVQRGEKFTAVSDIVKKLRGFNIAPEQWPEILDAFTTSPDPYRVGLIDLGTAPAKVLAAIPGINEDSATEIVFRREKLDKEKRSTIAWPVIEGVLTQDQFQQACDSLTTRSMQWRIIVEGGVEPAETGASIDPARASADSSVSLGTSPERGSGAVLRDRIVLEAVIDISSKRPRVAYLRDITHLAAARRLADRQKPATTAETPAGAGAVPIPTNAAKSAPAQPPTFSGGLDMDTSLDFGGLDIGTIKGTELNSGTLDIDGTPAPSAGPLPSDAGGAPGTDPAADLSEDQPPRDNRLGRWTTGKGGKP